MRRLVFVVVFLAWSSGAHAQLGVNLNQNSNGTAGGEWSALPSCSASGQALSFNLSNGTFSCSSLVSAGDANTFSAAQSFSANGAASSAEVTFSGAPYTGGTGTSTFPLTYMNCSGSTAPSSWSTAGTLLGINTCSGFAGNLLDFHVNGGASQFTVSASGAVQAASVSTKSLAINGTTLSNAPRLTWTTTFLDNFAGSNPNQGFVWEPSKAITFTRLDTHVNNVLTGCSTYPVVGLYDATTSTWIATVTLNSSSYSYYSTQSVNIAAGDSLTTGTMTGAVGCSGTATVSFTAEYIMQ
ncbi:MAG TPA: hypothetical protein VGR96_15715 [Acidobacteriaceae bacterium]|nr:hypothetical protein [Acidobacteriaceae bacterium]